MVYRKVCLGVLLVAALAVVAAGASPAGDLGREIRVDRGLSSAISPELYQARVLPYLSPGLALAEARRLGLTRLEGKPLIGDRTGARKSVIDGVPIATWLGTRESSPQVAISPKNERLVVMMYDIGGGAVCSRTSYDGGATFSWTVSYLPAPAAYTYTSKTCSALRYTSDGAYLIGAYVGNGSGFSHLILCRSADNGATWSLCIFWSGPTTWDLPSIGTHKHDPGRGDICYLTSTAFWGTTVGLFCYRITDWGNATSGTYSSPLYSTEGPSARLIQGARCVGLKDSNRTIMAWYDSGTDGIRNGKFDIVARDINWAGVVTPSVAAANNSYECKAYLGPYFTGTTTPMYHVWWTTMVPAIDVTYDNRVLIAWTVDPALGQTTAEEGNVYYTYNTSSTYTAWVAKKLLASSGLAAQGFQTLATQRMTDGSSRVYMTYASYDAVSKNKYFDIYKRISVNGGLSFGAPVKVTKYRSLSQYLFCGNYNDIAAHPRLVFAVWNDRAVMMDVNDPDIDILGAAID